MKKSKNLKNSLQTRHSNSYEKENWKKKDILGVTAGVIIAISIPVLMAIAIISYASLYKDSPTIREQINRDEMIRGTENVNKEGVYYDDIH